MNFYTFEKKTMFPKFIKLILAVISFSYGIYQFIDDYIGNGILMLFLSAMFINPQVKNYLLVSATVLPLHVLKASSKKVSW